MTKVEFWIENFIACWLSLLLRCRIKSQLLVFVQDMDIEGGHRVLGQRLKVTVHLFGGLGAEDLAQHLGEHGELVRII